MRSKAGMKFECIFEEILAFIDIDYTNLNQIIRYEPRQHGEWEYNEGDYRARCSNCHRFNDILSAFCPNCGADMRGEGKAVCK